jgi:light-regulated signal transduction histidine kinase (bacteriophytochrome)
MYDMDQSVVAGIMHNRPRTIVRTLPVVIAGHRWTVKFQSLPEFETILYSREPAIILISGLLISAMLFAITMALANTRARAMALAERMTRDLQKSYDQLQQAHAEMESFSYSVSHDLRAPLRSIDGFSYALLEEEGNQLDATGKDYLRRIRAASQRMSALIDAMLGLARLSRSELRRQDVNLSAKVREIVERLQQMQPERRVEVIIEEDVLAHADVQLIRSALENLLGNAWKFTGKTSAARIEFGTLKRDDKTVYFVKDNGVGFDMAYAGKLFGPFQRLHTSEEFDGTGIGLATVHRIISRHGGRVWAESTVGEGAIFYFTLT